MVHKHLLANCLKSTAVCNLLGSTEVRVKEPNKKNRVNMSELLRYAHISQMFWVGSTLQEYWKN